MSPAAILATKRPRKRLPRNLKPYVRKTTWECKLRDVRDSFGLSIDEVVENINVSKTAYWQIEKGGDPMLSTAVKIAKFYGRDIGEIWPKFASKTK